MGLSGFYQTGPGWENPKFADHYTRCVVCAHKARHRSFVLVNLGTGDFVIPDEATENPGDDYALWPIGSECLKKHPEIAPFVLPAGFVWRPVG